MPKYFLDCGAHDGCSVRQFRATEPQGKDYIVHSFEPNPVFWDRLRAVPDIIFHPEAVWIDDCEASFYLSQADTRDGSTLIASKTTGRLDHAHPITVRCLNFSRWMQQTFKDDDHIILKLDIEGAEYEVLRKMLTDGSIKNVRKLYIEFHKDKIGLSRDIHDQLVTDLQRVGLTPHAWDALGR